MQEISPVQFCDGPCPRNVQVRFQVTEAQENEVITTRDRRTIS
jgi:hypothetical protein